MKGFDLPAALRKALSVLYLERFGFRQFLPKPPLKNSFTLSLNAERFVNRILIG